MKSALTASAALAAYYDAVDNGGDFRVVADGLAFTLEAKLAKPGKSKTAAKALPTVFNAQNLFAAVTRVQAAMERRVINPVLSAVLVAVKDGTVTIRGITMDNVVEREVVIVLDEAPELENMAFCVDAEGLLSVLKRATGGVSMTLEESPGRPDDKRLLVKCGGRETYLQTIDAAKMPSIHPYKLWDSEATMDAAELVKSLAFVSPGISTEESRYYLNGVGINRTSHHGHNLLRFVATDGHRLLASTVIDPFEAKPGAWFKHGDTHILPRAASAWLVRHLPAGETVKVQFADRRRITVMRPSKADPNVKEPRSVEEPVRIRFTVGNMTFTTVVIDGCYPDYMRVIPRDPTGGDMVFDDPKAASETVQGVASISKEKARSVKVTLGALTTVSCRNMEGAASEAQLPCKPFPGHGFEIGYNARYLTDFFALAEGPVTFCYEARSPHNSPTLVCFTEGDPLAAGGRLGVLMPLRV